MGGRRAANLYKPVMGLSSLKMYKKTVGFQGGNLGF